MEKRNDTMTVNEMDASRVRRNTSAEINERLDQEIEDRVRRYATPSRAEITRRIEELDREKYALKALRGDFDSVSDSAQADNASRAEAALRDLSA